MDILNNEISIRGKMWRTRLASIFYLENGYKDGEKGDRHPSPDINTVALPHSGGMTRYHEGQGDETERQYGVLIKGQVGKYVEKRDRDKTHK